jgi:two-component system chemotaxis sensor kinase CheA
VSDATEGLVVVVEFEQRQIGILVDDLVGLQQTVIKSLGAALGTAEGLAGGAILGDGRVGLIVDVPGLIRVAHNSEASDPVQVPRSAGQGPLEASAV